MKKLLIGMMTAGMLILALIYASAESYLWPVPSSRNLSRGFYAGHEALDITGGGNIVATKSGKVFYVYSGCNNSNAWGNRSCSSATCSPSNGYWLDKKDSMQTFCNSGVGNGVFLEHDDGTYSAYCHMSTVAVSVGQSVKQGQVLGTMGSTGKSTGTHTHFEIANNTGRDGNWIYLTNHINNNPGNINYIYATPKTPVITSFRCTGRDDGGFMITCKVEDPSCVSRIYLATWDNVKGNNPATWQDMVHMTSEGDNIYKLYVGYDLFASNATVFYNDVYFESVFGETDNPVRIIAVAKAGTLPRIESVRVTGHDSGGYMTECIVNNEYLVDEASISTWTKQEGKAALVTKPLVRMQTNTFNYYVHYSDHAAASHAYWNSIVLTTHTGEKIESRIFIHPLDSQLVLTLPDNLHEIGDEAFADLQAADAVRIRASVETISENAFSNSDIYLILPSESPLIQWANDHDIPYLEE